MDHCIRVSNVGDYLKTLLGAYYFCFLGRFGLLMLFATLANQFLANARPFAHAGASLLNDFDGNCNLKVHCIFESML